MWYHDGTYLMEYGKYLEINDKQNTLSVIKTQMGYKGNSCYGSTLMPSTCSKNTEYQYKIKILSDPLSSVITTRTFTIDDISAKIHIGIDDAKCLNKHTCFAANDAVHGTEFNKFYSYCMNGKQYDWCATKGIQYGNKYDEGDIITMIYNPYNKRLIFQKNGVHQGTITRIHTEKWLCYRLCIYLPNYKDIEVKLL